MLTETDIANLIKACILVAKNPNIDATTMKYFLGLADKLTEMGKKIEVKK